MALLLVAVAAVLCMAPARGAEARPQAGQNLQLYPCLPPASPSPPPSPSPSAGQDGGGGGQGFALDAAGRVVLGEGGAAPLYVAVQRPRPASYFCAAGSNASSCANVVLSASRGEALVFAMPWQSGRALVDTASGLCLVSDQAQSHGYSAAVHLGPCAKPPSDSWTAANGSDSGRAAAAPALVNSHRLPGGKRVCLDAGSGGSSLGNFSLALEPAAVPAQQALNLSGYASWGGSVIGDGNGTYHMYAAVFANGSGLNSWTTHSEIMHAVASTPEGPFAPAGIVLAPFAHNPEVVRAFDGTYLLFSIGHSPLLGAASPYGPWAAVPGFPDCNNPTPVTLPHNSTLFVFCHGGPYPNHWGISLEMLWADHWRGPWHRFAGNADDRIDDGTAVFAHPCEDPFAWRSADGSFHILMHGFRMSMVDDSPAFGSYATAPGPWGPWRFQENQLVYNASALLRDGTALALERRERPKLLLDAQGRPTHLYNGVCPPQSGQAGIHDPHGHCFTMVVPIAAAPALS